MPPDRGKGRGEAKPELEDPLPGLDLRDSTLHLQSEPQTVMEGTLGDLGRVSIFCTWDLVLFHSATLAFLPVSPPFGSERVCCLIVILELGDLSH